MAYLFVFRKYIIDYIRTKGTIMSTTRDAIFEVLDMIEEGFNELRNHKTRIENDPHLTVDIKERLLDENAKLQKEFEIRLERAKHAAKMEDLIHPIE